MKAALSAHRACHYTDTQKFGEKERHTKKKEERKGAGNIAEWLTGNDFLVTCLGGASASRAGCALLRCSIVCAGLNGVCSGLCVYVWVCVFFFFFSPAMRAHTTVDSGAKWSLCRGGHEVREGGGEGEGW